MHDYSSYDDSSSPNKRFRSETEEVKRETYAEQPGVSATSFAPGYTSSQYPVRQPSISGAYSSMAPYSTFGALTTGSTSPYQFRPSIGNTTNYFTDSMLQTSGAGLNSSTMASQQRYTDMQQPFPQLYSSYGQRGGTTSSAISFSDDTSGLGMYRTASNVGLGEEHRPATATGIPNSMSMAQQTPQSQNSSHQSHDSLGSSRGASFSHSPEMVRSGGFSDRLQLGSQLPNPHRPSGRFDDQHMTSGLSVYSNQRNALQAPPAESSLTSHTDTGITHPSLHFNPDLNQSTDEHVVNNR